ncbi:cytochrome b5 domain-containing protein [Limosilactobacillus agrestimuris]|uniref:cytochrome b5 domain-containing protein n=1 Tax=Limosilactobacillus agrestimuris TaxID=2941331 RepID=UPI0020403FC3|nr:cytochrome b5 domain-containing protein [Limosilactobacillus agrestimuris]
MEEKTFTHEELAKFNGENGQPAYVAVSGTVYDVSGKDAWKGGKHHGNVAGKDLTDVLYNKSPHGDKVLKGLPVVGKLV